MRWATAWRVGHVRDADVGGAVGRAGVTSLNSGPHPSLPPAHAHLPPLHCPSAPRRPDARLPCCQDHARITNTSINLALTFPLSCQVVVGSSLDSVFMVMEYADHDLKAVMENRMTQPFSVAEVGGWVWKRQGAPPFFGVFLLGDGVC